MADIVQWLYVMLVLTVTGYSKVAFCMSKHCYSKQNSAKSRGHRAHIHTFVCRWLAEHTYAYLGNFPVHAMFKAGFLLQQSICVHIKPEL